jgi:hypothetical protein
MENEKHVAKMGVGIMAAKMFWRSSAITGGRQKHQRRENVGNGVAPAMLTRGARRRGGVKATGGGGSA